MYAYMLLITSITRNPAPHVVSRQELKEGHSNVIDVCIFHALSLSYGAFSCRTPPVPKQWDCVNRPHVALLVPINDEVFPVFLSQPKQTGAGETLEVADLDSLPPTSMIEVRHTGALYRYYRRDEAMWTKVGESRDPFLVEIEALSHAGGSVMLREVTDLRGTPASAIVHQTYDE